MTLRPKSLAICGRGWKATKGVRQQQHSKKGFEKVLGKGSQKVLRRRLAVGFTVTGSEKGSRKPGVLRTGFPEGAQNTPSDSTTPEACALKAPNTQMPFKPFPNFGSLKYPKDPSALKILRR